MSSPSDAHPHVATIAMGSNMGDRVQNIENALRLLEAAHLMPHLQLAIDGEQPSCTVVSPYLVVVDTSFLYESPPMYVQEQPAFLNGACLAETNIRPVHLLRLLKHVEELVGRVPSIRNGPRAIDLDLLFYDSLALDTRSAQNHCESHDDLDGELVVPHPKMREREFVLRPLTDIVPDFVHPVLQVSVCTLLSQLSPSSTAMHKVLPFPQYPLSTALPELYPSVVAAPPTQIHWIHPSSLKEPQDITPSTSFTFLSTTPHAIPTSQTRTHVMATLNVTPDSFSDGGQHMNVQASRVYVRDAVRAGADVVDVGGCSTRPGAGTGDVEEEVRRVVQGVEVVRGCGANTSPRAFVVDGDLEDEIDGKVRGTIVSVDTFRWEVAEAAICAGANCINDVYAFTGPGSYAAEREEENIAVREVQAAMSRESMEGMKCVARKYAVPVVLTHSRGDSGQNKDYTMYAYATTGEVSNATRQAATTAAEVLEGVRVELGAKVTRIVCGSGGVRRWLVVVDPGLGYSKTTEGNIAVLQGAAQVVGNMGVGQGATRTWNALRGFPLLLGPSRKSFIGAIIAAARVRDGGNEDRAIPGPQEREWGTAAAVACAVQQGAIVVRVHDVRAMVDVVRVAEMLWGRLAG